MALAKALYNLPKLSDDFMTLLRDLRKSAPDEDLMTQVRSASMLLDENVPETEALRRMVDYGSRDRTPAFPTAARTDIIPVDYEYPYESYGAAQRLENRLGRGLTEVERARLGNTYFGVTDEPSDFYRESFDALENAGKTRKSDKHRQFTSEYVADARNARLEAQRRMALEYLMGGVDRYGAL